MNDHLDVSQPLVMSLRRAAVYRALARGFFYPSGEVRVEIEQQLTDLMAADSGWPSGLASLMQVCLTAFKNANPEDLEAEYIRLFGPAAKAPLIETAYGNAYRLLGKAANLSDISGFYLAFGVKPGQGGNHRESLPEDHLAMELEFMSLLNAKEAMALHEGWNEEAEVTRDAATKFLREHLGAWLDIWNQQLTEANPPEFYAHLARAMTSLVQSDMERLQIQPLIITDRIVDKEVGGDEMICPMAVPSDPPPPN
ncbi:MAG: molecular chaperone TorD family protein [Magnetococcales bacterium]|nr:molecular chaperone TorD family protein [Magnetococcales bacterium]MBF0148494.1 molecular chaperone TorD family protein [Magnetococcales bacterium]MBF0173944.1 molecular chaperone TorD family protein [Magnetococcales bacterium]MBF0349063.1 molecular chaperone TorD family protein [Magnetococcales bacterium]MBF0632570.1 molecular chaperone TorD family protein [Magnetococcales bacterium]